MKSMLRRVMPTTVMPCFLRTVRDGQGFVVRFHGRAGFGVGKAVVELDEVCKHSPVFTQGLAGKAEHVLPNLPGPGHIPVVQINRGGQVVYHGPGQGGGAGQKVAGVLATQTARIPIKVVPVGEVLKKPDWIRVKAGSPSTRFYEIKNILREHQLHTVCEEASCPNIGECFGKGTATFMIMGDKCTRRCPFCDVGHGRPDPLDVNEPANLAKTIAALKLKYVVITSVDRDDLRDGGAAHFVECIRQTRELSPETRIEILVPDFRGRDDRALEILKAAPPDVMNHNLETAPRLYKEARPGSDYQFSLNLLKKFKALHPDVPTKSGIMVGLGETDEEILQVMRDMREHDIDMLTIGQYLAPSGHHLPVRRYVHPDTFKMFEAEAIKMGFTHAAVGAMVRSSYHADQQAMGAGVSVGIQQ
jgi:lipoic acid synthetase